ncbi:hypothetical protein AB2L28_13795 [Kineococcus sp. TBRC 1896]|uniref:Uncharacterized protein n=1 Tax=Kineococcus mangrovi TaxID=1660183 RepID=A0ABV4I3P4_9ACTN
MSEFDGEELDAQERRVRDLLRAAPDVGPMPDDVVARLDAALRAARPATPVASLAEHAGRRRAAWRRRLPRALAAAAGVAVVGGGALLVGLQGTLGADSGSGGSAAGGGSVAALSSEEVPPSAEVLLSGRDYADTAAVRDLGQDVLGGGSADATGPQGRADDATPGAGSTDRKPTMLNAPQDEGSAPVTTDESQRPAAERALACTKQLGVAPDSVLAVEIASWRSQPAAFVVHTTADAAEVVVVALDCTPGDAALNTVPVP